LGKKEKKTENYAATGPQYGAGRLKSIKYTERNNKYILN